MMKRLFALILALCLLLAGCAPGGTATTDTTTNTTHPDIPDQTRGEPDIGIDVDFQVLGSVAMHHSVNISQVRYITSVSALPDNEELAQYDDSWFEDHALLLIYQSVSSGNVKVDVEKIKLDGTIANITLSYLPDGMLGSGIKVTWLMWLEVEKGLQYSWQVENPAMESDVATQ